MWCDHSRHTAQVVKNQRFDAACTDLMNAATHEGLIRKATLHNKNIIKAIINACSDLDPVELKTIMKKNIDDFNIEHLQYQYSIHF